MIKEALNLKWSNVHIYSKLDSKRREIHLIRVTVPKEIAKNRKERTFRCAGGNYLMRLKKNSNFTEKDNYILQIKDDKKIVKNQKIIINN